MTERRRWTIVASVAVVAGLLAALIAPAALRVGPATSGDAALAAQLRAAIDDDAGYQSVQASVITRQGVKHAGIGEIAPHIATTLLPDTPIELGSITKTFNGLLLADAIRRGEAKETDPLSTYLPELVGSPIGASTLADVASHRAGIPPMPPGDLLRLQVGMLTNRDLLAGRTRAAVLAEVATLQLMGGQGNVQYSNLGATLLGWALAQAADAPDWPTYVARRLLEPLGMNATVFASAAEQLPPGAVPGRLGGGRDAVHATDPGYPPAGPSTWTTADDMTRYARAILAGDAPGMEALTPRWSADEGRSPSQDGIGFHWFTVTVGGRPIQWHNGGTTGYRTMLAIDREAGRAVFVVGNSRREVDTVALRLLTGVDTTAVPTRPDPPVFGIAIGVMALIGLAALVLNAFTGTTILQFVRTFAGAVTALALARAWGPWEYVPPWLWAIGVAVTAGTVAFAITGPLRNRPWHRPGRRVISIIGTVLYGAMAVAAVVLIT